MKKTIQRQKLAVAKGILEKIEDYFTGDVDVELADAILRNVESIDAELDLIEKNPALKEPETFKDYEQARIDLVNKYAEKDEGGNIVVVPGTRDAQMTPENSPKFQEDMETLKGEYTDLLAEVDTINVARAEFMEKDVEIEVAPISKSLLGKIKSEGRQSGFALTVISAVRPFLAD